MTYPNIALIGKKRAGKDTVADHLVRRYAYTRIAFADPLKELAYEIDPAIGSATLAGETGLRGVVDAYGWDGAKSLSEVRCFLQRLGVAMRERDEDYWLDQAAEKIAAAKRWNLPVVVTDVRFANEANYLAGCGFTLVRVTRPGTGGDSHISETELDDYPAEHTIHNSGTLPALYPQIDSLL